jgi:predicted transcriptional regulator
MAQRSSKRKDDFRLQNTVRLDADGIAKVLGDLEARVIETVWEVSEPMSARTVHELIAEEHPVAVLTVVTVLNKLVDKRLLVRRKQDGVYHYAATTTRDEFVSRTSRQMLEGILSFAPDMVATSFVDVLAEQDPEQLAELARLVRRRMRDQEKS